MATERRHLFITAAVLAASACARDDVATQSPRRSSRREATADGYDRAFLWRLCRIKRNSDEHAVLWRLE
jgi:hypothetical protein